MSSVFTFGEAVEGYPVRVVNERAVRAAAGLLFFPAVVSFMHSFLLGNFQHTRLFIVVFLIDMALRMVSPRLAPSMIVGAWIVRQRQVHHHHRAAACSIAQAQLAPKALDDRA